MNLDKDFPLQVYINLGIAEERRRQAMNEFLDAGLGSVERFPAIRKTWVRNHRGHWDAGRYALSLTQKLLLRMARQRKAEAVLIFEDDVVLAPDLHERLAAITLPEDWGIFYLGCQHMTRPQWVQPGLVRVGSALDLHAVVIRGTYYAEIMRLLSPTGKGAQRGVVEPSDRVIANLHGHIPTYACYPNLAWQRQEMSTLGVGWRNDNYSLDGIQRRWVDCLPHLWQQPREDSLTMPQPGPITWVPERCEATEEERRTGIAGMLAFAELAGRDLMMYWPLDANEPGEPPGILSAPGLTVYSGEQEFWKAAGGIVDYRWRANLPPEELYGELRRDNYLAETNWTKFEALWRDKKGSLAIRLEA